MRRKRVYGFSLLELLAVVTIIGIIAAVILPRLGLPGQTAKAKVCDQFVADLNAAIERYYFDRGSFPANLSDLQPDYYPDIIPTCPVTGAPYAIDSVTHSVTPHNH